MQLSLRQLLHRPVGSSSFSCKRGRQPDYHCLPAQGNAAQPDDKRSTAFAEWMRDTHTGTAAASCSSISVAVLCFVNVFEVSCFMLTCEAFLQNAGARVQRGEAFKKLSEIANMSLPDSPAEIFGLDS